MATALYIARPRVLILLWTSILIFNTFATLHVVDSFAVRPASRRTQVSTNIRLQETSTSTTTSSTTEDSNVDNESMQVLYNACMETKQPASDLIIGALRALETQERQLFKQSDNAEALSQTLRANLVGDWQLVLVTDKRLQSVISIPVRNIFSIRQGEELEDEQPIFEVENAIRVKDWVLLSFLGTMAFNARKRQGSFDYNRFTLFNYAIDISLKPGEAERIVSTVEKRATPKTKKPLFGAYEKPASTKPFFNFFVANDQVAAARGSVGGFALWNRVP